MTQIFRLDKIADVGSGNSAPQKEELFKGGTLPFVRTSDVGTIHIGSIESSGDLLTPEGAKGLKLQPAGTILFPKSGASTFLNHRVLLSKNAYVSSHLATIKANNELAIDRYLFYFLQTIDARNLCQDQAYPSLNRDQIGGIEVPVPSLEKQHEIVKKLDRAFDEIDLLEENLAMSSEKAIELQQSLLSASFVVTEMPSGTTNPSVNQENITRKVKLSEVCSFSRGLTYSKSDEVDFSSNVVLRANNIDRASNSLNLEDLRYIKDSIKIKKEKIAKKNSLIICTASGSKSHVGKVALIDEDYGYAFGGFMGQLTPSSECHPKFLYYVLTSGTFKDFLMSLNDGTNINNLKFSDIKDYEVELPTLDKQSEIINKLDTAFVEIEFLKLQINLEKDYAVALRQSLLSHAFTPERAVS